MPQGNRERTRTVRNGEVFNKHIVFATKRKSTHSYHKCFELREHGGKTSVIKTRFVHIICSIINNQCKSSRFTQRVCTQTAVCNTHTLTSAHHSRAGRAHSKLTINICKHIATVCCTLFAEFAHIATAQTTRRVSVRPESLAHVTDWVLSTTRREAPALVVHFTCSAPNYTHS